MAVDAGRLDADPRRVVAREPRRVDHDPAYDSRHPEAYDRVVASGLAPTPGLPAVVDLALRPESVGRERRRLRPYQVLSIGEQLVVRVRDRAADHARREIRQPGEVVGHGSPRLNRRPAGAPPSTPTGLPCSHVSRTRPRSVVPAYGVAGLRWWSGTSSTANTSSGANTHRSASWPTAMAPLRASPTRRAGRSAIHRVTSRREWPRVRA